MQPCYSGVSSTSLSGRALLQRCGPSLLQHIFPRTVQCRRQRDTRWIVGARYAWMRRWLTALDKIHKAIRSSLLLCFGSRPGRQCADTVLTAKLLMEKSRMWPDRPLAMIKVDIKKENFRPALSQGNNKWKGSVAGLGGPSWLVSILPFNFCCIVFSLCLFLE